MKRFPRPVDDPNCAPPPTEAQVHQHARHVFDGREGKIGEDLAPEDVGWKEEKARVAVSVGSRGA